MGEKTWGQILAQPHEISVFAEVLNFRGIDLGLPPLPVETLNWSMDATARPVLSGNLRVPLVEEWVPTNSYSALTPFGNQLEVWVEIRGGNRFAKCRLGFALIKRVQMRRPEHSIDIEFTDFTDVLMQSHIQETLPRKKDKDITDWQWFQKIVDDANHQSWERDVHGDVIEPHREGIRLRDPDERISRTHKIAGDEKWNAGQSRMAILDDLAQRNSWNPSWLLPNRNGALSVRAPALLDPTQAPSAGSVEHVLSGGEGGTLISVVSEITREGAFNELLVRNDASKQPNTTASYHITSGAMKRGRVGKRNHVEETSRAWTQAQLNAYTERRLQLYAGVRRSATIRAMINPFIEPGDTVETYLDGARERWTAKSVSLDFPSGMMTITGQGYIDERATTAEGRSPRPVQDPVNDDPPAQGEGQFPKDHKFTNVEKALNNGKGTSSSVKNAKAILRMLAVKFPQIKVVGGYRASDPYPDHPSGLALDIMMPSSADYGNRDAALGNSILRYLIRRQKVFGLDYAIWNQRYYQGAYGNLNMKRSSRMSDRGSITANHIDHIHVLVHPYSDFSGRWTAIKRGSYWNDVNTKASSKGFILPMKDMAYKGGNTYSSGHPGVDYGTTGNGNLLIIADGAKISSVTTSNGNMVRYLLTLPRGTMEIRYYHMKNKALYPVGKVLKRGTKIGVMGNTGNSSGAHLHFEARWDGTPYNPLEVMKAFRAPIGGPSHGADLSKARMETLRRRFFGDKNWSPVAKMDVYGLELAP